MDHEQLLEIAPQAQARIYEKRKYEKEVQDLENPIYVLQEKLDVARETLRGIFWTLPYEDNPMPVSHYGAQPINLGFVKKRQDNEFGLEPSGHMYARIVPVQLKEGFTTKKVNEWREHRKNPIEISRDKRFSINNDEIRVEFYFQADDDGSKERLEDSDEYTYDDLLDDSSSRYIQRGNGVASPPSFYSEENVSILEQYTRNYLPKRIDQINNLENTIELIKNALDRDDLNPWYKPHLATLDQDKIAQQSVVY